jgi:DNA-binding beta-propeller fold protein YncE
MARVIQRTSIFVIAVLATSTFAAEPAADLQPLTPTSQKRLYEGRNYGSGGTLALSPDTTKIVAINNNYLAIFDINKPERRNRGSEGRQVMLEDMQLYNAPMTFHPDGKTIVVVASQHDDPAVHFIDFATGKPVRQIDNDQQFMGVAVSPDGKYLALGAQQRLEIWDAATGNEFRVMQGTETSYFSVVAFSPTSAMLASAGDGSKVQLWETATGKERTTFRLLTVEQPQNENQYRYGYRYGGEAGTVASLAFSPDGKLLAVGCFDRSIRVLNLLTGEELPPLVAHTSPVGALRFTADGKSLVSIDHDGTRMVWSVSRIVGQANFKPPKLNAEELTEVWNDLAESDVFRTYRAMRLLSANSAQTLPFLEQRVKAIPAGDTGQINQLLQDLQNQNAGVRRHAMSELRKHGEAALGALNSIGEDQRHNRPIQVMIAKLERQLASPDRQRAIKAVQILEKIGDDGAKQQLEKLSQGAAGARLTVDAKAALERLNKK